MNLKEGDVVYHKIDNMRMVVMRSIGYFTTNSTCRCRYFSNGDYKEKDFYPWEFVELDKKEK